MTFIFSQTHGQLQLLKDVNTEAGDNDKNSKLLIVADSRIFFTCNNALWTSNGSGAATIKLKTFVSISYIVTVGNKVYSSADDGVHGKVLCRSNGAGSTTVLAKDIRPGSGSIAGHYLTRSPIVSS